MLKPINYFLFTLLILASHAFAGPYDRNTAQPVEKVVYGGVISVRNITKQELIEDKNQGWRTFGGALLGGVLGNQFGKGSGRDIATALGAIIGGSMARNHRQPELRTYQLVELMIKQDDGQTVRVIQDLDPGMLFHPKDRVRVIYLKRFVRVDIAM
ncbi:glycine zipper 2TM domain-containing protein [Parashewanella curva]|uniref:Glycine zipper 2TM domain-containing protein n=1 Tax=Parashewanella curva TaxID=2338552 RepID=A0A3L8PZ72_9GAMM|nr:glycine zipper 2TM domain-containing protein [Parashewanella curva]RLV60079.1 glycine zipper 2TM domain-containing protein [Parashewanella curva]